MSLDKYEIGIVIPAYNEEKTIGTTLHALKQIPYIDRILVVDDGSGDKTGDISLSAGAEVLRLKSNGGKAYAMKMGYEALRTDVLVFLDADIGETASEVVKLIEPICSDKADAVIAKFPMTKGKGGFGFVKKLSVWGLSLLAGKSFSSVLSGQRAFLRSKISEDYFKYKGFGIEFGMTVDMLRQGIRIVETEVSMKHRTTDRDWKGFVHRYRQFVDILKVIVSKMLCSGGSI